MNEWLSKLEIFNSDGTPGAREDAPFVTGWTCCYVCYGSDLGNRLII